MLGTVARTRDHAPVSDRPDSALLTALAGTGPAARAAWYALAERHSGRTYAVAASFDVPVQAAESLVLVAWLRLLERAHLLHGHEVVGVWLATVVRREAVVLTHREGDEPDDAAACRQLARLLIARPPPTQDEIAAALARPRGSLAPLREQCAEEAVPGSGEPAAGPVPPPELAARVCDLFPARDLDRELAELRQDAERPADEVAFELPDATTAVTVRRRVDGGLDGLVRNGALAEVGLESLAGELSVAAVDDHGAFRLQHADAGPLRLRLVGRQDRPSTTDWFLP